ncbi:hypothetical protein [Actinomyces capricornis]|uniref:DUF350 domain-containing protein n=1 Tax=Actinomyces capricornis TaxID=2755559 RepID=A0ABM7UEV5_9ACTO|nr:hypothetical protein [Actinomyces capricornis]MDO5064647.1 hypothetical protein [Actinomyces bowdenii]BDA65690.1 hypothetical protein MANAM107_25240 [Actinomyces capricornis]
MSIDWTSLGLVTAVTVMGTAFIIAITSLAARMLDEVHIKRITHEVKGLHAAEVAAGFFLLLAGLIVLYGLWLIIPYFH